MRTPLGQDQEITIELNDRVGDTQVRLAVCTIKLYEESKSGPRNGARKQCQKMSVIAGVSARIEYSIRYEFGARFSRGPRGGKLS